MIDQETPGLNYNLWHFGCYLFSILEACRQRGKEVPNTVHDLNEFYDKLLKNGVKDIKEDCTVEDPDFVFALLGVRTKQVFVDGKVTCPPDLEIPNSIEILCYHWVNPKGELYTHFMLGDGHGKIAVDSIKRGSNTARNGFLHSKRIFELLE